MRNLRAHVKARPALDRSDSVPAKLCEDNKGQGLHPLVRRLGSKRCAKNASRDWWRGMKEGPETRLNKLV